MSGDPNSDEAAAKEPLPHAAWAALRGMRHLRALDVSHRAVTEAQITGLLAALTGLQDIALHGCPLEPDAITRLERGYPAVHLHCRGPLPGGQPGSPGVGCAGSSLLDLQQRRLAALSGGSGAQEGVGGVGAFGGGRWWEDDDGAALLSGWAGGPGW